MRRSVLDRLKDIVQSAESAVQHAGGLDAGTLAISDQGRDAALFRIAIVGEAASHLPAEIQTLSPEIPWMRVKDTEIDLPIAMDDMVPLDLESIKATAHRLIELIGRTEA